MSEEVKKKKPSAKDIKIKELEAEVEKQKDLMLRTAAEFDNYKKRTEREKTAIGEFASAAIIKKLLPTIDNAFLALTYEAGSDEYNKGIELLAKQLAKLVDEFKLIKLANIGDEFDPNIHEAVMFKEDENLSENQISEVLQQGYKIGDTIIRPAMVSVVK